LSTTVAVNVAVAGSSADMPGGTGSPGLRKSPTVPVAVCEQVVWVPVVFWLALPLPLGWVKLDPTGQRNTLMSEVCCVSIGGRPAIPMAVQRDFWAAVRSGMVVAEAAASVGVSITVAWRWFRHVGGVMPDPFPASKIPIAARRLSFQEREEISCRRAAGDGVRAIARVLGRSPSR